MENLENNKLIAEFMGLLESSIPNKYWSEISEDGFGQGDLSEPKYHESWDWLMPVVEKIESIPTDEDVFYDVIMPGLECSIGHVCNVGQTKMEAVYKSVVEFIKWYNEIKQND